MSNDNPLMSVEEVAEYLNVPVGTVRWMRYKETGPTCIKVGRVLRYRKSDVDAYIEQQLEEQKA